MKFLESKKEKILRALENRRFFPFPWQGNICSILPWETYVFLCNIVNGSVDNDPSCACYVLSLKEDVGGLTSSISRE